MLNLSEGCLFLVLLNGGLAVAGLFLLRKPEGRNPGLALIIGAAISTGILGVFVSRLSEVLFGTRLIDVDLFYAFSARPGLPFDLLILAGLLLGIKVLNRRAGGAVILVGLCAAAGLWFALDRPALPQVAAFPIFVAAFIGISAAKAVSRIRWLAAVPLLLSASTLAQLLQSSARLSAGARVRVPPGFEVNVFAQLSEPPVSMTVDDAGALYVTTLDGRVFKLLDNDGDGIANQRIVFAESLGQPLGIAWHSGQIFISTNEPGKDNSGRVVLAEDIDGDGRADHFTDILTGLPSGHFTWHQNNEVAIGHDQRLYVGVGSTTDHDEEKARYAASILSANLDGSELRVFANGFRNPFGIAFAPDGRLFATDNGPDRLNDTLLYYPVDELNLVVKGGDYGFPHYFGQAPAGSGTISPVASFAARTAPTGLAVYSGTQFPAEYRNNVFVALWNEGPPMRGTSQSGLRIARISLVEDGSQAKATDEDFATGLMQPIDVEEGIKGELFIADMLALRIYRVTYVGP